jgi:DNA-binding MarR family transcriptional regulator
MPTTTDRRRQQHSVAPRPEDVAQRFRGSLMRLTRTLRQHDGDDLSPTLASTLFTIGREGPLTSGEIARRERMKKPSVTAVVDRLVALGLVERRPDATDGRVVWVAITDTGRRRIAARRARRTAWLASRLEHLDPADLAVIVRAAEILDDLIELGGAEA